MAWRLQGLDVHFSAPVTHLTCSHLGDQGQLWHEDALEIFLQPDPTRDLYLEVESEWCGNITRTGHETETTTLSSLAPMGRADFHQPDAFASLIFAP